MCTETELATLEEWNFIRDFSRARAHYLAIVSSIFLGVTEMSVGALLDQQELARILKVALEKEPVFDKIIQSKLYIRSTMKPVFADLFARYITEQLWPEASRNI